MHQSTSTSLTDGFFLFSVYQLRFPFHRCSCKIMINPVRLARSCAALSSLWKQKKRKKKEKEKSIKKRNNVICLSSSLLLPLSGGSRVKAFVRVSCRAPKTQNYSEWILVAGAARWLTMLNVYSCCVSSRRNRGSWPKSGNEKQTKGRNFDRNRRRTKLCWAPLGERKRGRLEGQVPVVHQPNCRTNKTRGNIKLFQPSIFSDVFFRRLLQPRFIRLIFSSWMSWIIIVERKQIWRERWSLRIKNRAIL